MAIDLKHVEGNTATVKVTLAGESADVVYYPAKITLDALDKAMSADVEEQMAFLLAVIKSWDIKMGGKKLPVSEASLRKMPHILLRAIFNAVAQDSGDLGEA